MGQVRQVNRYNYYFNIEGQTNRVYPIEDIVISGKKFTEEGVCVAFRKSIDSVKISRNAVMPSGDKFVEDKSEEVYLQLVSLWADQEKWTERYTFIVDDIIKHKRTEFLFNILDCVFDFDYGEVEIEFKDRDEYFAIDEKGDDEVDLFTYYPVSERQQVWVEIKPAADGDIEWYCNFGGEWFYDLDPTYEETIHSEEGDTHFNIDVQAIVACTFKPPFSPGWQFDEIEERWYGDPSSADNGFIHGFKAIVVKLPDGISGANETWIKDKAKNYGINQVVQWYNYHLYILDGYYAIIFGYDNLYTNSVLMDNALTLGQCVDAVADHLGYTVNAQYGNMFSFPHQLVMQKSDFKRYEVSNNADKFKTTFNKVMKTLLSTTNMIWWVDGNVLNLRPAYNTAQYFPLIDRDDIKIKNVFNINYENIPYKESWSFMEQGSYLFDSETCIYNLSLKSVSEDNKTTHETGDCTVDLFYIFYNIDEISDDGMVLLACDELVDSYKVRYYKGFPNGELSTRYIQDHHFCYNRPIKRYYYGSDIDYAQPVTAKTVLSLIELDVEPFALDDQDEFNPQNKMKVQIYSQLQKKYVTVEGYIYEYEYNTKTRVLELKVRTEFIN